MTKLVEARLAGARAHILVGSREDLEEWRAAQEAGRPVKWIVPKGANPGECVLFFFTREGLLGEGILKAAPRRGRGHWPGRYVSEVEDLRPFVRPLAAKVLVSAFPKWGWPTYPRSYVTVPAEYLPGLSGLLQRVRSGTSSRPRVHEPRSSMHAIAEELPPFNPQNLEDGRKRTLAPLIQRQGQGRFRQDILTAYGGRCALTGCGVEAVLEAAHLIPYRGRSTNHPSNGVLLRSDLHALLDQGLLGFDGCTYRARLAPSLKGTEYEELDGRRLRLPRKKSLWPSTEALARRGLPAE